jgi:hypothetical protein
MSIAKELATPGELKHTVVYDFEFRNVEKQFESYHGINAKLRLCLLKGLTDFLMLQVPCQGHCCKKAG